MAKRPSKRDQAAKLIAEETEKFHPSKIAGMIGASVPYVQNIINTLEATGKLEAIKEGKKTFYKVIRDDSGEHNLAPADITSTKHEVKSDDPIFEFTVLERFDFVRKTTQMVVEGCSPSMFLTGPPGIGKTHLLREQLAFNGLEEGTHFHIMKGHISPFGLYSILYHNRERGLVIFDDADKVFENDIAANILKAALDSYDTRRVMWFSRTIPEDANIEREFNFEGQVIFISNVPIESVEPAIKSRTICINLAMSRSEITEHMRNVLPYILPEINMDLKLEVLDYLGQVQDIFGDYNLRTLIKGIRIRHRFPAPLIWQGLIRATAQQEE